MDHVSCTDVYDLLDYRFQVWLFHRAAKHVDCLVPFPEQTYLFQTKHTDT